MIRPSGEMPPRSDFRIETKDECAPAGDAKILKEVNETANELSTYYYYAGMHRLSNENDQTHRPGGHESLPNMLRGRGGIMAKHETVSETPGSLAHGFVGVTSYLQRFMPYPDSKKDTNSADFTSLSPDSFIILACIFAGVVS